MGQLGAVVIHEVKLLGSWEYRGGDSAQIPAGQLRLLLTSLALSANKTVAVDTLAAQLWPDRPAQQSRAGVHTYVGRLRKLVGPGVIDTRLGGYQLSIEADVVDVHRFRRLVDRARAATSTDAELACLRSALALWRGTPFADLGSTWLDRDVAPRLTEEWSVAVERRMAMELAAGDPEPLIPELRDLAKRHPTHEVLWRYLIIALHRSDQRSDALAAYQQLRARLREELGVDPSPELVALHEEIKRAEPLVEPVPAAEVTPRQLPHDIARFTGRSQELAELDGLLASDSDAPTIVLIDGPPGVGKTTLAVHWAHRVADRYRGAHLHVNLRGYGPGEPLSVAAATEKLLRSLSVPAERIPSDVDERATLLRSLLSGQNVLLLLDNARNADQVRPLLPGTAGLVIVTSRGQLRGLYIRDGAHRVTVHRLPQRQSIEMLDTAVGKRWVASQPQDAAALVELCDRLPLAIAIVAERAHRAGSLGQVIAELEDEQARLDVLSLGEDDPQASLRAALSWSYQSLGKGAAAMFRLLGMHPAGDIELRAAAALADLPMPRARAVLDQLVAAHLVEQRRPNRYQLHDLIRLYANEMAEQSTPELRQATIRRMLDWYLHAAAAADSTLDSHRRRDFLAPFEPSTAPPTFASRREAVAWFEEEYECLRSACAWGAAHGFAGHVWRIAKALTSFFHHIIPRREAAEFYEFAISVAHAAGDAVGEAYLLNSLACICFDVEDLNQAARYAQRAFDLFESQSHRLGVAMTLGNLALILTRLGDSGTASDQAVRAMVLYEELGYARGVAQVWDTLGLAYLISGEYDQAVASYRKALVIVEALGDTEVAASARHHLAKALCHLHDFPNATREFRKSIGLYRAFGSRRLVATVLADFATMLTEAGHPTIARALWESALPTLTEFTDPRALEVEAALAGFKVDA